MKAAAPFVNVAFLLCAWLLLSAIAGMRRAAS